MCADNVVSVQFHGEEQLFDVLQIKLSSPTASHTDKTDLVEGMANLSLISSFTNNELAPVEAPPTTPNCPEPGEEKRNLCETSPVETVTNIRLFPPLPPPSLLAKGKVVMTTKLHFMARGPSTELGFLPSISFIGGLQNQLQLLKELVLYPLTVPELQSSALEFPHGVLLHGPAGGGKSLLARALLGEVKCHRALLSAPDLLAVGQEGASKLEQVMSDACQNAPSMVVLDDLDMMCPCRGSGPSEVERRATASLMSVLDSLSSLSGHVVLLATTSQLEAVEGSLRRPGRFDCEVEIPPPTAAGREEILGLQLSGSRHSVTEEEVKEVAWLAHGRVGADLKAVCHEAQRLALRRACPSPMSPESLAAAVDQVCISGGDLKAALRMVPPSAMREAVVEVPKVSGGVNRMLVGWPLPHHNLVSLVVVCDNVWGSYPASFRVAVCFTLSWSI